MLLSLVNFAVRVQRVRFPVHLDVCVSVHFNKLAAVAFLPPPRSPAKNIREPRFPTAKLLK